VLQHDEHECGQRHHPQERIAEPRAGGHVGSPVAGVDEAHGDQQAWTDIFEYFKAGEARRMLVRKPLAKTFGDHVLGSVLAKVSRCSGQMEPCISG